MPRPASSPASSPADWTPEPPAILTRQIEDAIRALGNPESLATASAATLIQAAEALFERTLRAGCTERASAVALLTVDALVTYAFERASDHPRQLEACAEDAMARLARLGVRGPVPEARGS